MSGGSYDYVSTKMQDAASSLRERHADQLHVIALAELLDRVAKVMHDIEWADSCDTSWTEQLDAEIRAVLAPGADVTTGIRLAGELLELLNKTIVSVSRYATDTEHTVFVEVSRELLPRLEWWSEPVRIKVDREEGRVLRLVMKEEPKP